MEVTNMMGHDTLATDAPAYTTATPGKTTRMIQWVMSLLIKTDDTVTTVKTPEPEIYIEDTIRGETMRFTGKDLSSR